MSSSDGGTLNVKKNSPKSSSHDVSSSDGGTLNVKKNSPKKSPVKSPCTSLVIAYSSCYEGCDFDSYLELW